MVFRGQDKWRRHPVIYNNMRKAFPGLRNAVGLFGVYVVVDTLVLSQFRGGHH